MKLVLTYMCLLMFSFQVLPVKEIGKLLYKSQLSEEIGDYDAVPDDDVLKLKKEGDPYLCNEHAQACARVEFLTQRVNTAINLTEFLPQNFAVDIFTPPPDRA